MIDNVRILNYNFGMKALNRKYGKQFNQQRCDARKRNIDFKFTYEEWEKWWGDDIKQRGVGPDKLVMARYNDVGPYKIGNIKKITMGQNTRESKGQFVKGNIPWNKGIPGTGRKPKVNIEETA